MSNDPPDDDGPSPLDNLVQFKKPSGSQNRAKAAASPTAAGQSDIDQFEDEIREQFKRRGPPPRNDPRALILWQQEGVAIVQWAYEIGNIGPMQHVRLKGILESVRTGGMIAVKALDKKKQKEIADRLGLGEEKDDGLDEYPGSGKAG